MSEPESVLMRGAGGVITRYIREDHAAKMMADYVNRIEQDRDAIWNEAIEAAAERIQRRIDEYIRDHSDCDYDPETGLCEIAPNVAEEIEASEEDIRAIRALKRQQGGGE